MEFFFLYTLFCHLVLDDFVWIVDGSAIVHHPTLGFMLVFFFLYKQKIHLLNDHQTAVEWIFSSTIMDTLKEAYACSNFLWL